MALGGSYATTDTMNRCLSLVWWREYLGTWGGSYIAKPNIAEALFCYWWAA